ncbi:dATP/dGTP diphosphohydrolase domain-containing protein [Nitratidesulfovibrio sp. 1201_IL3209]|uniref:dATP/dGTP diphosphohydrolase domain-containing protein n=1 Tax=Nitratidesulfovibrio sp. 1201_IL3209 TaxID=3084053 RepID=UPI002FDA82C5
MSDAIRNLPPRFRPVQASRGTRAVQALCNLGKGALDWCRERCETYRAYHLQREATLRYERNHTDETDGVKGGSTSGRKDDAGKPRYDLIPPEAQHALAEVFTRGAERYGERNWEAGFSAGRLIGALDRHITAYKAGQDKDRDSGMPHLWHVLANAAMLVALEARGKLEDDRPTGCAATLFEGVE